MPAIGVPATSPVPSPLSTGVTPGGQRTGAGQRRPRKPVVVTVNVLAPPVVKVVEAALVIAGAWSTVRVNVCVAAAPDAVGCLDRHG